jgi:fumarate reductase subunit C
MLTAKLYMLQRITALLMAPFVLGHLVIMIVAIQGGLSTAEILSRTQGSVFWFLFYGTFALAVSVHASIGLRVIVSEMFGIRSLFLNGFMWATGLTFFYMGARAASAVTIP